MKSIKIETPKFITPLGVGRNATGWEFQVGKHYVRFCTLWGGRWNSWKVWKRVSFHKEQE